MNEADKSSLQRIKGASASVEEKILFIRDQKVLLDNDLADIYDVGTKVLNQAVKRNLARFPPDFMFQLTEKEYENVGQMRSQFVTASKRNIRFRPYAFTEHGAVMLATILKSQTAIAASIQVVRAFVSLRSILSEHKELAKKIETLEQKYDERFKIVFTAIKQLMSPSGKQASQQIGFIAKKGGKK